MVAEFLAGVIVGVLIGLAVAPILRAWIGWQVAKSVRDEGLPSTSRRAHFPARSER